MAGMVVVDVVVVVVVDVVVDVVVVVAVVVSCSGCRGLCYCGRCGSTRR